MRIENYLGFPTGISGSELAERAAVQAGKFGARLPVPTPVTSLTFDNAYPVLHLDTGETVSAKCLLIATGADYRRLTAEGCEKFEGSGVYYAATPTEAPVCRAADVVVVGGGNSAGQAAVFLAGIAQKVYLVVRGSDLYKDMSAYLARRIEQTPNIEVLLNTEVRQMRGDDHLNSVDIVNRKTGEVRTLKTPALFCFIGAVPRTEWLPPEIEKDAKSFIRTGRRSRNRLTGRPGASPSCSRPADPASSLRATYGRVRQSGSPRPSARGDGGPVRARILEGHVAPGRVAAPSSARGAGLSPRARRRRMPDFSAPR